MNNGQNSAGAHQPVRDPAVVAAQIPFGLFIMAATHEDASSGTLVRWVQRCSIEPLMVMISLVRGQPVEPLIRDSRHFTLCQISVDDRFLQRKFADPAECDDLFVSLSTRSAPSGAPILDRAMSYMDCELIRNVDLESDHRLYVGQVHHAELLVPGAPAVFVEQHNGESIQPTSDR